MRGEFLNDRTAVFGVSLLMRWRLALSVVGGLLNYTFCRNHLSFKRCVEFPVASSIWDLLQVALFGLFSYLSLVFYSFFFLSCIFCPRLANNPLRDVCESVLSREIFLTSAVCLLMDEEVKR